MTEILNSILDLIDAAKEADQISEWSAQIWSLVLTFVVLLTTLIASLWKGFKRLCQWRQRRFLTKDLAPYFTKVDVYKATKNYIHTKCQNVAPSEDEEPGRQYIASVKTKLIPLLINKAFNQSKDDNKYYLILADAGMGKTTFMINLYLRYKRQWFIKGRRFNIRLFPLGNPHVLEEIANIDDEFKKDTILLLDALDEDAEAVKDYLPRFKQIMDEVWRFREIVITCRTQFFPSRDEEPTETGYYKLSGEGGEYRFQKLYISVFDDKDIAKYLHKHFTPWNPYIKPKLNKAKAIAEKSPNLLVRPMLLSHIEELVEGNKEYEFIYDIYQVLIQKWVEREANKPGIREKFGSIEKFKEDLLRFSKSLAINLYLNQSKRGGLFIHKDEEISTDSGIQLSDLEKRLEISLKESKWRSRSLINRNAEGYYKFSHKSILEYFLAKEAIENPKFTNKLKFEGLDTAKIFCKEMIIGLILKKTRGTFTLRNQKKTFHLDQIKKESDIQHLKITSGGNINPVTIKFIDSKTIHEIAIKDENTFPILYILYLYIYLRELRGLRERLGLQELPELQKLRELLELQEYIDLLEQLERLKRLELPKQQKLQERLERLELLKQLEQQNTRKRLEQLKQIEWLNPEIIQKLHVINQ